MEAGPGARGALGERAGPWSEAELLCFVINAPEGLNLKQMHNADETDETETKPW